MERSSEGLDGTDTNTAEVLDLPPCSLLLRPLSLTGNNKSNNRVIITTTMNFHNEAILIFNVLENALFY